MLERALFDLTFKLILNVSISGQQMLIQETSENYTTDMARLGGTPGPRIRPAVSSSEAPAGQEPLQRPQPCSKGALGVGVSSLLTTAGSDLPQIWALSLFITVTSTAKSR